MTTPVKRPRKTRTSKSKAKVDPFGLSSRNPFAPFAEQILKTIISPKLATLLLEPPDKNKPVTSRKELLRRYNATTKSRVSMATFSKWLNFLGYQSRTVFFTEATMQMFGLEGGPSSMVLSDHPMAKRPPEAPTISDPIPTDEEGWDRGPGPFNKRRKAHPVEVDISEYQRRVAPETEETPEKLTDISDLVGEA